MRKLKKYEAFGESKTVKEWLNDPRCKLSNRDQFDTRFLSGWSVEDIITRELRDNIQNHILDTKVGRWLVLKRLEERNNNNQTLFLCRCECGIEKKISYSILKNQVSRSCGCLRRNPLLGNEGAKRKALRGIKQGAKNRNLIWELSDEQVLDLVVKKCYYCGQEPNKKIYSLSQDEIYFYCHGLDRIDSNKGYLLDNIVPCCKQCNYAKLNYSQEDFKNHIIKIYNYYASK